MKVMLQRTWEKHVNCCGCQSFLKIHQEDLRMVDDGIHIVCEICDTKTPIGDVPEYITKKLKELLAAKRSIDTKSESSDH